jgi:site-specific recombinase XerD
MKRWTAPPRRFLESPQGRRAEAVVRRFHRWLDAKHLTVASVQAADVERFFQCPFRKLVTPRTAQAYKRGLIEYLVWLDKNGTLSFDPRELGIRQRRELPQLARSFLRSLEPTHRPSTCRIYRTSLGRFHGWLQDARVRLKALTRQQTESWLLSLSDEGLHPSTRHDIILHVRSYLRWLGERGELRRDPDDLLRTSDLPKLPTYLPRPLPPDVDHELQRRLAQSLHPLWQGLLLMRHTGLRVGELRMLEHRCIRTDSNGNCFLKVPLGKLHTERLVPVSPPARAIIDYLQQAGRRDRAHLLERVDGTPVRYADLRENLRRACEGLVTPEPITSHRLRHTYATSLLNAGMSLVSVMKLLGHRDHRMTLRYTAITQETVGKEYAEALEKLETRYAALRHKQPEKDAFDPDKALNDVIAWVKENLGHDLGDKAAAHALAKRLVRVREAITNQMDRAPQPRKY